MKASTQEFIKLMREKYGPEEPVARANVLNFGGQITLAIRNSRMRNNAAFFAIQQDFLENRFIKHPNPPLGIHTALICEDQ